MSELFNFLILRMEAGRIIEARSASQEVAAAERQRARDAETVAEISGLIDAAASGSFTDRVAAPQGTSQVLVSACSGINQLFDLVENSTGRLSSALEKLAGGNLDHQLTGMGAGHFGEIERNYNASVDQFRRMRETSAKTMANMTNESRAVADDADSALHEIKAASDEALKIVSIIETISSKTSLLAINASIEATHAGEHGKAFGVVASQVHDLSQRVGEASAEIDRIIKSNAATVDVGVQAITRVRDKLSEIESEIGTLSEKVETGAELAA